MKSNIPWSVKGIEPETRAAAKKAAKQAGMTLGEWMNSLIKKVEQDDEIKNLRNRAPGSDGSPPRDTEPLRQRDASAMVGVEAPVTAAHLYELVQSLNRMNERLRSSEKRSRAAVTGLTEALPSVLERLRKVEIRDGDSADFEVLDRLEALEGKSDRRDEIDSLKSLEKALRQVVHQFEIAQTETIERVASSENAILGLSEKYRQIDNKISQAFNGLRKSADEINRRIVQTEEYATQVLAEAKTASAADDSEAMALTSQKLHNLNQEINRTGTRITELERELDSLANKIETSEERSSKGISGISSAIQALQEDLIAHDQRQDGPVPTLDQDSALEPEFARPNDGDLPSGLQPAPLSAPTLQASYQDDVTAGTADNGSAPRPENTLRETSNIQVPPLSHPLAGDDKISSNTADQARSAEVRRMITNSGAASGENSGGNSKERSRTSLTEDTDHQATDHLEKGHNTDPQRPVDLVESEEFAASSGDFTPPTRDAFPTTLPEPGMDQGSWDDQNVPEATEQRPLTPREKVLLAAQARHKRDASGPGDAPQELSPYNLRDDQLPDYQSQEPIGNSALADGLDDALDNYHTPGSDTAPDRSKNPPGQHYGEAQYNPPPHYSNDLSAESIQSRGEGDPPQAPVLSDGIQSHPRGTGPDGYQMPRHGPGDDTLRSVREAISREQINIEKLELDASSTGQKHSLLQSKLVLAGIGGAVLLILGVGSAFLWLGRDNSVNPSQAGVSSDSGSDLASRELPSSDPFDQQTSEDTVPAVENSSARPAESAVSGADGVDGVELYGRARRAVAAAVTDEENSMAFDLMRRAAVIGGYPPAQYELGELHREGIGVIASIETAKTWYLAAAEAGNVKAMHRLGTVTANQEDGIPNTDQAISWLERAASYGYVNSIYNLGFLYNPNNEMLARDERDAGKSMYWFLLAASLGDDEASQQASEITSLVTPEKLAEIQARVAAFQPSTILPGANDSDE